MLERIIFRGLFRFYSCECCTSTVVQRPFLPDTRVANEPILEYLVGSKERIALEEELCRASMTCEKIPCVIGGETIFEGPEHFQAMPHNHRCKIAQFHYASEKTINRAIDVAVNAQAGWERVPFEARAKIWIKGAELIAGQYRQKLNAATMLGQSKTVIQAEIDAACELIDFLRFNVLFLKDHLKYQPISEKPKVTLNSMRLRGIDGFWACIAPFNFTAISGNLAYTPALMGNSVLWKPSDTAVLSSWHIFNIMREAGVPDGVINFLPSDGPTFGKAITKSKHLAGINFTGSVPTFNWLCKAVGNNIDSYINYPRLVGECGGKNYHFVHSSADICTVLHCTMRSAFEYCGQKCSACSRMYIPKSLCAPILQGLCCEVQRMYVGNVMDFRVFMGAVIDHTAFKRITGYICKAINNPNNKIIAGGGFNETVGYFIQPTIIVTTDPQDRLMKEEIFGPILTIYIYEDKALEHTIDLVCKTGAFALTGAIFSQDQAFLAYALEALRNTAGNFYINDKSTGAVVGQQPFGGGHKSGTNDKAGGPNYVMRFTTPQTIKETFCPVRGISYPYMCDPIP